MAQIVMSGHKRYKEMSNKLNSKTDSNQFLVYQIRINGHLSVQWTDWFGGLTISLEDNGDTLLTGPVVDQAALHGLLKKVRDLGMPLVSVNRVEPFQAKEKFDIIKGEETTEMKDRKVILSTVWIFVMFNYLYCDVVALMDPKLLKQFMTGNVGGIQFTEGFLLGASILMEIPIAMVLLSRILNYKANRWANIVAGTIMTLVQVGSLFGSSPAIYYIFFSIIEISVTALIVWYAWKWSKPEGQC